MSPASIRASIVSAHTKAVGSSLPIVEELIGKITQKVGGPVAIAEHQLDSPEHRHHLDLGEVESDLRDGAREGVSGRGSGVVHQSEICLDERFTDDQPPVVDRLALLAGDGGFTREHREPWPTARQATRRGRAPRAAPRGCTRRPRADASLASSSRSEPRLLDLTHSHQLSSERTLGDCRGIRARDGEHVRSGRRGRAGVRVVSTERVSACEMCAIAIGDEPGSSSRSASSRAAPPVRERSRDVSLGEVAEAPVGEESRRSPVVAGGLDECFVAQRHLNRGVSEAVLCELSEHVSAFGAGFRCITECFEDRDGARGAARDAVQDGRPAPAVTREREIVGCEVCGELEKVRADSWSSTRRGAVGGRVELCRDLHVGTLGSPREMERALLRISHHEREVSVHSAALPDRSLLVADGRVERVGEAHSLVVQHDQAISRRCCEGAQHCFTVSMCGHDELHRGPCERGGLEEHLYSLGRADAPAGPPAPRSTSREPARRDPPSAAFPTGPSRVRLRARRTDCRVSWTAAARARAASGRARLVRAADDGEAAEVERPDDDLGEAIGIERAVEIDWDAEAGRGESRSVASTATGSAARRRSAICKAPAEAASSHWMSSSARTHGPEELSARRASNTASPIASGSGMASPGSASSRTTSSARRRGPGSSGSDVVEHRSEKIRQRGKRQRRLGLDATAHQARGTPDPAPPRRPLPRGSSCRCPPHPRSSTRSVLAARRRRTPGSSPALPRAPLSR